MPKQWQDERAYQLYLNALDGAPSNRHEAIRGLGRLARKGSKDAAWALGQISRNGFIVDRRLAAQELAKE